MTGAATLRGDGRGNVCNFNYYGAGFEEVIAGLSGRHQFQTTPVSSRQMDEKPGSDPMVVTALKNTVPEL